MNDRFNRILQYNFSSFGCWIPLIITALILGSIGLGWVVNGFLILLTILLLTPLLVFVGVQWWLKRNLIQDNCPVCEYEFTGFKNSQFQCPNCNEPLQVESDKFQRITPPGTIDIEAVEVSVKQIESEN